MSEHVAGRERPILFSGPMVRAILEGRKTQTRRVVKPQPIENAEGLPHAGPWTWWNQSQSTSRAVAGCVDDAAFAECMREHCPYGAVSDRLWVRETWCDGYPGADPILYRASYNGGADHRWRPSIFMRREHSRLTLGVTAVRVERLQNISEEDAVAEGLPPYCCDAPQWSPCGCHGMEPRDHFRDGWNGLNAKRGYSWESNPWVWAITFRPLADPAGER